MYQAIAKSVVQKMNTAGHGLAATVGGSATYVDSSTNFSGPVYVEANDPSALARQGGCRQGAAEEAHAAPQGHCVRSLTMGTWVHRITDIDRTTMKAVCARCGPVPIKKKGGGVRCVMAGREARGLTGPPPVYHRLTEIDMVNRTAICAICGPTPIRRGGRWRCSTAERLRRKPYSQHRSDACEKCGFTPEHPCQLDVDHLDGDHANNAPENLQTLCANCHRLKTWEERH